MKITQSNPGLQHQTVNQQNQTNCSICWESITPAARDSENSDITHLNCGHSFHTACLNQWRRVSAYQNCPECRAPMNIESHLSSIEPAAIPSRILPAESHAQSTFDHLADDFTPNAQQRINILEILVTSLRRNADISMSEIAQSTSGFSLEDLKELITCAAIHASRDGRAYVVTQDFTSATGDIGRSYEMGYLLMNANMGY